MKKFTKYVAAAMALATVISTVTACGGEPAASGDNTSSTPETTTTGTPQQTLATDEGVQSAVDNVSVSEEYTGIEVTTKPIWMAWWEIQEDRKSVV